ncbi:hypothetical protein VPH35_032783 [Triticum aestivum]
MDQFPDGHHVRRDDEDGERAAIRQSRVLLNGTLVIHGGVLHTGAATGAPSRGGGADLRPGGLRRSLAPLDAPPAVDFHHEEGVYTGATYGCDLRFQFFATQLSGRAPMDQYWFHDGHHVRPRSRGLLRDDDDDDWEGAARRQSRALLNVPPAIHGGGLRTGASAGAPAPAGTGLRAGELDGSHASLGAPLAADFHDGDVVYLGACFFPTQRSPRAPMDGDGQHVRPRSRALLTDDEDDGTYASGNLAATGGPRAGRRILGREQYLVQRRRGDSGSGGVVLICTGRPVCCFGSADDGNDAMPSTSANAITAGTAASADAGGAKAAMDVMLARGRYGGGVAIRLRVATDIGATYWFLEIKDWIGELMGSPRQYRPMESWSWIDIMGRPIAQDKGSCALSACLMCLEAQHRLAFERRHGSDTFPYAIPRETAADLLVTCKKSGVWTRKEGAIVGKVLEAIQRNGGAVAWHEEGLEHCKLQIKSWERLPSLSSSSLARIMRTEGPLIGCLDVVRADYYAPGWRTRVYTGGSGKKKAVGHGVVCMEYRLDGELIRLVDNHNWQGPVRWISKTAFWGFTQIKVEPLDAGALGIEVSWRRRLLLMLWREETFWWRQRRTLSEVWNMHH